jgi:Lon protease-like protein
MPESPMFPLGMVHFPHVPLPLRVFEPRYRQLTIDCLDGDRRFGVVLIERGSEVGGGDVRSAVGTMTEIVQAGFDQQGFVHLDTVGVHRVRVLRWLDDSPYPRAEVEDLAEPVLGPDETAGFEAAERHVRRALALRSELGLPAAPYDIRLDEDPSRALFQLGAIAPLGPLDQQTLLATEACGAFLGVLSRLVAEEIDVLEARLAGN